MRLLAGDASAKLEDSVLAVKTASAGNRKLRKTWGETPSFFSLDFRR